jgi:hypothetical protein
MLPFYLLGQAQFEKHIDLAATIGTIVAIAIVSTTFHLSLTSIGWIQVIIGVAKAITKVAYVVVKGWLVPFREGLLKSWACQVGLLVVLVGFCDGIPLIWWPVPRIRVGWSHFPSKPFRCFSVHWSSWESGKCCFCS